VCRPERVRRGVVLALFDDLEVVVTERVPEEAPEFVAGLRERAILEEPSESLDSVVELGEQPAVELSEVFVGRRIRVRLRRQRLDELRGVPQLADQLLARAEVLLFEREVVADGGPGGPVARGVDRELRQHRLRLDDVTDGLRHLLPILVEDVAVDHRLLERNLTGVLVALHQRVEQPEADDIVALWSEVELVQFGVFHGELPGVLVPVPAGVDERGQAGGGPRVEHVVFRFELVVAALGTGVDRRVVREGGRRAGRPSRRRRSPRSPRSTTPGTGCPRSADER